MTNMEKPTRGNNIRWVTFNLIMDARPEYYPRIFGGKAIKLTHAEKMVWIILFRHARRNVNRFEVTLSYSRLAYLAMTSKGIVETAIHKLKQIRAIQVITKGAIDGTSNKYEIRHFCK